MSNLSARLAEIADLVAPRQCAGCARAGSRWCPGCARWFANSGPIERMLPPRLPVIAAAEYAGPVRAAVCAWKEHSRVDLTRIWAAALRPIVRELPPDGYCLIPVPSTGAARGRRGWRPVTELARTLAGLTELSLRPALSCVRVTGDQVGLGREARRLNISGAFAANSGWLPALAGRKAIIVDDILTTGATVAEAHRALRAARVDVVAAITIAATPSSQPSGGLISSGLDLPNSPDLA
ncbi:MAG: ComF family protein [Angustibacter sp.]